MSDLIDVALAEDLGDGDLTTRAVVPEGARARAEIRQKEPGMIAGLRVAQAVFERVDPELDLRGALPRGQVARERRDRGDHRCRPRRSSRPSAWRSNFLGRLSGVATLTARYVRAVEGTGARILDTRKTTPGLRELEKEAVRAGGGVSHRSGLYDAILVKENHAMLAGGVGEAARRALRRAPPGIVEIECATLERGGAGTGCRRARILLDNMSPDELRSAVELAGGRAELEASGGITLETIRAVAETGVDYISVGALTHSAPALDVSLLLEPL